ncbi:thiosulfate/3-mercaptopyruvate sulfurtransferase [Nocardioides zeae]|uniref:Thiosulfate/3-mercaptopyruvate sulfurtransferase n=1 Tax=Nocardioides zeae TaxID=1457234 RepID=A0ACC6IF98_9ACTN|nr:rhodanese-like domain-containing protein [Nocardioides zeae]MDR6174897.1 thiosulfate/3-mercaptopyruvate sulfurtransferase [Nocardioides zeae]MDR6209293.1 thiosulfate/3-mercaptopyruvate sulfurtransferase [Nocardioides zeae]
MSALDPVVGVDWLRDHLGDDDLVVLDAGVDRTAGDPPYEAAVSAYRDAHVLGALHVDLVSRWSDPTAPDPFTRPAAEVVARRAAEAGIGPRTRVVVYDRSTGAWAARVWWLLRWIGHDQVGVLDGGWAAWQRTGAPVGSAADLVEPVALPALPVRERPGLWADVDEVEALARTDGGALLCALRAEEYAAGGPEGARGHVPGSASLPYRAVLDDHDQLDRGAARRWAAQLEREHPDGVVLYCGGGINAAGLAWALHSAGYENSRVYDGSLTQWRRLGLPLTTAPVATPVESESADSGEALEQRVGGTGARAVWGDEVSDSSSAARGR